MYNQNETEQEKKKKNGTLYIVSTPIGNDEDITLRALRILKKCDLIICEDGKIGSRLLKRNNIDKKIEILSEQNERDKSFEIISILRQGKDIALVSDCGTPVFADPGKILVNAILDSDIDLVVIPGVSSIMTAVVRSGFSIEQFLYAGFLSREKEERFQQLKQLRDQSRTVVLLETPYRLMPLLEAAVKLMPTRRAYIGCNLTMHFETNHYGTFEDLFNKFKDLHFKGEFVLCFQGDPFIKDIWGAEIGSKKSLRGGSSRPQRSSRDFPRKDSRDFPRKDNRDFPRKDSRDFPRKDSRDFPRKDNRDFPRKDSRDFPRKDSRDFPRKDNRDYDKGDRNAPRKRTGSSDWRDNKSSDRRDGMDSERRGNKFSDRRDRKDRPSGSRDFSKSKNPYPRKDNTKRRRED